MRFRFKRGIPVEYEVQGYIYFTSRRFDRLSRAAQEKIRRLCREAGGEHEQALFAFVTTDAGALEVCSRYFLSESTLERAVKRYYQMYAQTL